jgi:hypothetical protein
VGATSRSRRLRAGSRARLGRARDGGQPLMCGARWPAAADVGRACAVCDRRYHAGVGEPLEEVARWPARAIEGRVTACLPSEMWIARAEGLWTQVRSCILPLFI